MVSGQMEAFLDGLLRRTCFAQFTLIEHLQASCTRRAAGGRMADVFLCSHICI